MKIKETIERECCNGDLNHSSYDLLPYNGTLAGWLKDQASFRKPQFCKYCGQIWIWDSQPDGAGSSESVRIKYVLGSNNLHDMEEV